MQYTLFDLLRPEHILIGLKAANAQEALRLLNQALVASGHTLPEFADDVWKREQEYPTGLPTQPIAVAIPHADPDHVQRSAVAIGVLNEPVTFAQMGSDGSLTLAVKVVILLAIKEREKQVTMIQQVISLIQNAQLLENLCQSSDSHSAHEAIRSALKQ